MTPTNSLTRGGFIKTHMGDETMDCEDSIAELIFNVTDDPGNEEHFFKLVNTFLSSLNRDFGDIGKLFDANLNNTSIDYTSMLCIADMFKIGFKEHERWDYSKELSEVGFHLSSARKNQTTMEAEVNGSDDQSVEKLKQSLLTDLSIEHMNYEFETFFVLPMIINPNLLVPFVKLIYYR